MKHDNALNTVLEKGKCLLLSVFMQLKMLWVLHCGEQEMGQFAGGEEGEWLWSFLGGHRELAEQD